MIESSFNLYIINIVSMFSYVLCVCFIASVSLVLNIQIFLALHIHVTDENLIPVIDMFEICLS